MPKWFDEKMLHLYWIKNCKKYRLPNGTKILDAKLNSNFDRYPDISENQLETGEVVPCEIEWNTTDFDHDISILENSNGFLVTFIENAAFSVPQVKIDEEDFIEWFSKNSKKIARDTFDVVRKISKERTEIFVWLIYLGRRGNKDAAIAFDNGVWGFPKSDRGNRRGLDRIKEIKANDIVIFVRNFSFSVEKKKQTPWTKDSTELVGSFEEIAAVRVTKGYYKNTSTKLPWNSEKYPYRFDFDKNLLFRGKNVPCNPKVLGEYLHQQIVSQIAKRSIEHINSTYYLTIHDLCAKYSY